MNVEGNLITLIKAEGNVKHRTQGGNRDFLKFQSASSGQEVLPQGLDFKVMIR
jgi:hypothetical protein